MLPSYAFWIHFLMPKVVLFGPQNRQNGIQNVVQNEGLFCATFLSLLGPILAPFGAFWLPKWDAKLRTSGLGLSGVHLGIALARSKRHWFLSKVLGVAFWSLLASILGHWTPFWTHWGSILDPLGAHFGRKGSILNPVGLILDPSVAFRAPPGHIRIQFRHP